MPVIPPGSRRYSRWKHSRASLGSALYASCITCHRSLPEPPNHAPEFEITFQQQELVRDIGAHKFTKHGSNLANVPIQDYETNTKPQKDVNTNTKEEKSVLVLFQRCACSRIFQLTLGRTFAYHQPICRHYIEYASRFRRHSVTCLRGLNV